MTSNDVKNLRNIRATYWLGESEYDMVCEVNGKEIHFLYTTYKQDDGYNYHIYSEDANIWDEMSVPELNKLEFRIQNAIEYGRRIRRIAKAKSLDEVEYVKYWLMEDDGYATLSEKQWSEIWNALDTKRKEVGESA
jgi:hypothetical protein